MRVNGNFTLMAGFNFMTESAILKLYILFQLNFQAPTCLKLQKLQLKSKQLLKLIAQSRFQLSYLNNSCGAYIEIPVNRFIQSWENKFACDAIYIMLIERNCMSK